MRPVHPARSGRSGESVIDANPAAAHDLAQACIGRWRVGEPRTGPGQQLPVPTDSRSWAQPVAASLGAQVESAGGAVPAGTLTHQRFGPVEVVQLEVTSAQVLTVRAGSPGTPAPRRGGSARVGLVVPLDGELTVRQARGSTRLGCGEMVVVSPSRPYELCLHGPAGVLVVLLPSVPSAAAAGRASLVPVGGPRRGSGSAVVDCVLGAVFRARNGHQIPGLDIYLTHLAQVALAIARRLEGSPAESVPPAKQRVLSYLSRAYLDPDLTPASAAAACGMSTRSLSRLFLQDPSKFSDRVREIRIEHAQIILSANEDLPLGVVAAVVGFRGPAQFHRAFRQVTGATPAAFRASSP
jgi:AraC-like DNA-binding protein